MTNKLLLAVIAMGCFGAARGDSVSEVAPEAETEVEESIFGFNAGADLRIRQEIMHNVPNNSALGRGKARNHMRFRPRVWGEVTMGDNWRIYTRLTDEFRWGVNQHKRTHATSWPGEVVLDNLYLEGKGLFEDSCSLLDSVDFRFGRQDIYRLYGLDHIFVDGTSGDGSRTVYADMVNLTLHFTEESKLDLFGIYNKDREWARFGTHRSHLGTQLTGLGGYDTEMDDWGFGAIWSSKVSLLDYQLFAIQKNTASFHTKAGAKVPRRQVNLFGTKLVPHWTKNFSTPLEAMVQVGENGANEELCAWAGYAGLSWKDMEATTWRPFVDTGLLALSGDKDGTSTGSGRGAWDPMWYRGIDDSEMMLYGYGAAYGCGWWSNMYNFKTATGLEIGPRHKAVLTFGPMFAQERDGLGGGDGFYKGFLTQIRYDFPLLLADKSKGERFEIFGHVLLEWFNPGDYFVTDKPAYFVRWQIDFKF